jgi:hypothetical protein
MVLLAWCVAKLPVDHQGRRPAPVQVDRLRGAEAGERIGQLPHRDPGLVVMPALADDGDQLLLREPERRARVTARGDVRIELA